MKISSISNKNTEDEDDPFSYSHTPSLESSSLDLSTTSSHATEIPPFDVNRLGVEQPKLAVKDVLIIVFMLVLWAYSLYLTYRAWYKLLYSDTGESERSNMWR